MAYMSDELDLDPRSLVVLHLVGRAGSLSGAARELGWTHPAVSQHVRQLERRVGTALVERSGRGVRLTPAGAELCRHADALAAELARARTTAAGLRHREQRVVRVAAFPTACATFLVDAIHRVHDADPEVRVEVWQAEPPEALAGLQEGRVDLAVVFDPPALAGVQTTQLGDDQLVAVLPARDPRSTGPSLTLPELAHDVVIAGCPTCQARFVRTARAAGLEPRLHHQVTDDYVLMQAMVAAGQGIAVQPGLALRAHHRDDVVALPLAPAMGRRTCLAVRPGTRTGALELVHAALTDAARG